MTVLDAGCGQGRHSLELLRRGCHALALDLNLAELKYTRFLLDSLLGGEAPPSPQGGETSTRRAGSQGRGDGPLRRPFPVRVMHWAHGVQGVQGVHRAVGLSGARHSR